MKDYPLLSVVCVACVGMCSVMMLGQWYDALTHKPKIELVPCSVTIENMARNLNVTLMDECVVEN